MESTPREDVYAVKMTTQDFEYYINLDDNVVVGFDRTYSSFERCSFYYG